MQLTGFHHLTAVTANARRNHDFYTATLGLRLVKKSVNQDDVAAYHLFYADGRATPGTDITFFHWPARRETRGGGSVIRTGLRVANETSLKWWQARFDNLGVSHEPMQLWDGRPGVDFEDFEGQRLSVLVDDAPGEAHPWLQSPVPAEHQVRGIGPVCISVPALPPTERVLTQVMNMRRIREYQMKRPDGRVPVHVFQMGARGPAAELHVLIDAKASRTVPGAGGVHHVAFRTPNVEEYDAWNRRLAEADIRSSGPIDRYYFRSLYFREPGGILFEIATDGPGFTADEPLDKLGERLALPPFLEARRREIEAGLEPL